MAKQRRAWLRAGRIALSRLLLVAGSAAPALAQPAPPSLEAALGGRWSAEQGGSCARAFEFRLAGTVLRVVAPDGHVDTQRVLQRREAGIATETTASTHGFARGTRWVYEMLAPGQLSITDAKGESASFGHCHDPIPAGATAAEFLGGLFALYVSNADASLPFASVAGLHAFLVPDLAAQVARYFARLEAGGRIDTVCLAGDPIVLSAGDYKVTDVHVAIAEPQPATADRATGTVSFKNVGAPASVRFDLQRTPAGWRIDDLQAGTGPSLRTQMAPCVAAAP